MRHLAAILILALGLLPGAAQAAPDQTIDAFFAHWKGMGISKNPDSVYFGVTERDFDVIIRPSGACRRIRSIASSANEAMFQSPLQPQMSKRKLRRSCLPCGELWIQLPPPGRGKAG